jgi:hypothetical protein
MYSGERNNSSKSAINDVFLLRAIMMSALFGFVIAAFDDGQRMR